MSILQPIREVVFKTRHRLRNTYPVWYRVLNRKSRGFWNEHGRITQDNIGKTIVETLKKEGIAVTDVATLFPEMSFDEMRRFAFDTLKKPGIEQEIAEHEKMIQERVETGAVRAGKRKHVKDFIVEPWGSTGNNILPALDNPFIKANLDDGLIQIVGSYLGLAPRFRAFSLRLTLTSPDGAKEYFSQRWHRDNEDKRLCKMFIYMTDVLDDADGPFKYIKESHAMGRYGNVFPSRPPSSLYPDLGGVEKVIPADVVQTCFGRAGTVVLADTGGLHKGGYTTSKPRFMYTGTFFTDASVSPIHLKYEGDIKSLSPLAKFALER
ncbi:MAG: hypothetical protein HYT37_00890 [Candidatus Sungbacteria bacterium]|nr:hypothetical protein [Candidatus Sungbacteria bacterium]